MCVCVFCVAGKVSVISRNVHLYKFYSTFLKTEHDEYTLYSHVFTFRCVFHVNTYSFSIFPCISQLGSGRIHSYREGVVVWFGFWFGLESGPVFTPRHTHYRPERARPRGREHDSPLKFALGEQSSHCAHTLSLCKCRLILHLHRTSPTPPYDDV